MEEDEDFGVKSESSVESMVEEAKEEAHEKGAEEMYVEAKKERPIVGDGALPY